MPVRSGWLTPTGQTRQHTRLTNIGATTPVDPLGARSGILPGTVDGTYRVGGLGMNTSGPMTATVHAGRAVVQGAPGDGAYPVALDQDMTLTFADGDALNPRIDLVVLRVYDNDADLQGRYEAVVEIVKGEPKAAPEPPPAPARSLVLFSVKVRAGASAGNGGIEWSAPGTTTDLRTTTVAVGGILPVYNNAGVTGSYPGQYQDNDNAHYLQRWNGEGWIPYPREIGGIAPAGILSTGSYTGQFRENAGVLQRWNGTAWVNYQPPVEVTTAVSGVTAMPNWAVVAFAGRKTKSGLCTLTVTVTRTGPTVTSSSAGQIADEPLCTLPTGWRPAFGMEALAGDGYADGAADITSGGIVNLRTWSPNGQLTANRNIRVSATFVL
ncbi:hypothetical protein [Streptomyces roseicoloratus]|uniref:Uncharacterized protein n=1 Tax=Streptomyces roseicoloratus TaxID=2508722 RepID=A0ABY9RTQ5_9ACTN|nr:hypothetical protein [Streptomyces roseicoloratus]WMX45550.1 hypothetical protein RGF97_12745 [Streptomyces roseicoloratus]